MALPPPKKKPDPRDPRQGGPPQQGPPQGPPPMGGGMGMDPRMAGLMDPSMMMGGAPPAPPPMVPPSAMGGPMTPGMDGAESPLLAALGGGPQAMGPPPVMPPEGMLAPNSTLDGILELLQQMGQAPTGQEDMLNQVGPGATPGPTEIDPQMLAMMMGPGQGPTGGGY
jgi:hypothetical protein